MLTLMADLPIRNWYERFEVAPGRWVHVPTTQSRSVGNWLVKAIRSEWAPPSYYANFAAGGHLAALRRHQEHQWFVRADIKHFYAQIGRNRVVRTIKHLCSDYDTAWRIGVVSTVANLSGSGPQFVLPFGFPQSPILAARALRVSALGNYLHQLSRNGFEVTVYADDIIVSSNRDEAVMSAVLDRIRTKAVRSRLLLNEHKTEGPTRELRAFNIDVRQGAMEVSGDRFHSFKRDWSSTSSTHRRVGIENYVGAVCRKQLDQLTG